MDKIGYPSGSRESRHAGLEVTIHPGLVTVYLVVSRKMPPPLLVPGAAAAQRLVEQLQADLLLQLLNLLDRHRLQTRTHAFLDESKREIVKSAPLLYNPLVG